MAHVLPNGKRVGCDGAVVMHQFKGSLAHDFGGEWRRNMFSVGVGK
jgi:hypothetical protein